MAPALVTPVVVVLVFGAGAAVVAAKSRLTQRSHTTGVGRRTQASHRRRRRWRRETVAMATGGTGGSCGTADQPFSSGSAEVRSKSARPASNSQLFSNGPRSVAANISGCGDISGWCAAGEKY